MKDNRAKTSAINGKLGGRPRALKNFKALPGENWRPIKGYTGYFISDRSRVISVKTGKPVLLSTSNETVSLTRKGKRNLKLVHHLVQSIFNNN